MIPESPAASGSPWPATDADVPAFWQGLGLAGLIDLHIHFMPERVMAKVWAYFDRVTAPDGGSGWPIHYRTGDADRLRTLEALGVRAFPSLIYPHKAGMAEWLNGWAAGFAQATPGCLQTATFFPEPGVDRYVAEALERGARIFKVHVQVGAYDPRDPLLRPVWRRLAEARVPVVVHCGSGPEPGPFTGPGPFGEVLAAAPELVVLIAHMGMPEYRDMAGLALRHPNAHLDTSVAFTAFTERRFPFPADLVEVLASHPDRVVLGSDFPNIPHPYAEQLAGLASLGLGDDWLRAVCYRNAARLLGLPEGPTA